MAAVQPTDSSSKKASEAAKKPDNTKKILIYGLGTIAVLAIIGFAVWWIRPPEMHGVVLQSPQRLTDFTLNASTGEPMSLSDFRGKPVLIYFGTIPPGCLPDNAQRPDRYDGGTGQEGR